MNIQSARFAFLLSTLLLSVVSSGGIEICPSISLGIDNPAPVCSMESMTVGAWFTELPGLCKEVPVTYLDKQWTWVVEGVEATPSSGKGSSATFTNITGGEGSITFALRCRVRACEDCNTTFAITTNFTAIKVDIAESNVVLCSYDTSATLSLTGDSYSPSGFVWNSTLWKKSKDGASVSFDPSTKPPGIYTVRASSRSRSACSDVCQVSIVRVDLDVDSNLDGVCDEADELLEDGSGRLVGVNNDDDNANGTNDLDEAGVVVGENDLVPIYLRVEPTMPTGAVILDAPSGGDKIKVWKSASKDEEVHLPMTWYPAAGTVPDVRYIEGIQPSDQPGDVQLRLRYLVGPVECADEISMSVLEVDIAMDGDRDDAIHFDDPDDAKYLFWVNNDIDVRYQNAEDDGAPWEEDDCQVGHHNRNDVDCADNVINCKRDLEDFTRLHIKVDDNTANLSGITYSLKFENAIGSPAVNVFKAVDTSSDYLSDPDVATDQLQMQNLTPDGVGATEVLIDAQYIKSGNQVSPFIIEGRHEGKGNLTLIVKKGEVEVCRKSVQLELHTMDWFFDIFRTSVASGSTTDVNVDDAAQEDQTAEYPAQSGEYFLFVHGWNMPEWEKERWAATVFKRLWWQGYKGKVGLFSWPTLSGFQGTLYQLLFESHHFDNSEFRSWLSSDSLKGVFDDLNSAGELRVLAHSMGNVVSGEAIRKYGGTLHAYIASQAALPAHCYDNAVSIAVNQVLYDVPWWPFDPAAPITTPNLYGYYHLEAQGADPYLDDNQSHVSSGNMRNYYNVNDWALVRWELNNVLKPDGGSGYLYGYTGQTDEYEEGIDQFSRGPIENPAEILSIDDERQKYQIFAYCDESRVKALGQVSLGGGFSTWNLATSSLQYNDEHYSHSREFRSNIADEWDYWSAVMQDCDFTSTIPQE